MTNRAPAQTRPRGRQGFALFGTPIGRCAVAWGRSGVLGLQLPERSAARTRARISERVPGGGELTPPADIRRLIKTILASLDGELVDLSWAPLDMAGIPPFHRAVYEATRSIPTGMTLTYGQVAALAGAPRAARAVGHALGRNPFPLVVPCHRVLGAGGVGGFSADGGVATKRRLLALEGVRLPGDPAPVGG